MARRDEVGAIVGPARTASSLLRIRSVPDVRTPTFLDLPERQTKPRARGLTHVLDKGLGLSQTVALVEHTAPLIDIVKVGWGIAYLDPGFPERLEVYRAATISVSLGGTLLEIAEAQGRTAELAAWARDVGVTTVEVSNGLCAIERRRKTELIELFARDFVVLSEVGAKSPTSPVVAQEWLEDMTADLAAGASWVVTEGRESGTVGIYQDSGGVRRELVDVLVGSVSQDRIIFEAPQKAQQTWFIQYLGPEVNLGNIAPDDVLPLETLRLGLRADTASIHLRSRSTVHP